MIREGVIDIPVESLDRAHRIGKKTPGENGVTQPIIFRFIPFRDKTKFYRGHKIIKQKQKYSSYSIGLDLTWKRLSILQEAREKVEGIDSVKFVYADVNCNLRVFTEDGKHLKFNSIAELESFF